MDFDDFYIFKPSINSVIHNSWFYNRKLSKPEKTVELFFLNSVINARSKKKILIPLFVFSGFAIFVLSIPLIVKFSVNDKIFTNINSVPAKQFAIVLGVGLRPDGTPGTYLRSRLDDAVKLYKGNIMPASIDSPFALYDEAISSFGESPLYDHKDAEGFINLYSLPTKIQSMMKKKVQQQEALKNNIKAVG